MIVSGSMNNPGSQASRPDLDWSQVRETIALLCLANAQIEATMADSADPVHALASTFTGLAHNARVIAEYLEREGRAPSDEPIAILARSMLVDVNQSVVNFQFYDRLQQKLAHVNKALGHLSELISDPARLYNPQEWVRIQTEISGNYTMECERLMFEMIMRGSSIEEALQLYRHRFNESEKGVDPDTGDNVELF